MQLGGFEGTRAGRAPAACAGRRLRRYGYTAYRGHPQRQHHGGAGVPALRSGCPAPQCTRHIIQAVIGAADTLDQAACALRRSHIDDEIDVAVDPKSNVDVATTALRAPAAMAAATLRRRAASSEP